jgi:hypothetical protein
VDGALPEEVDLLSEAAVARVRGHPLYLETARRMAVSALEAHAREDLATRWLLKDLGRTSTYTTLAMLDALPEPMTAARLARGLAATGVASRGRVIAFVAYAEQTGRIVVAPGEAAWAQRPLILTQAFYEPLRRRFEATFRAMALIAPEAGEGARLVASDDGVRRANRVLAMLLVARPELGVHTADPLRRIFMMRDAGMRLLQHFVAHRPADGERLLEGGAFSRSDLSRRYGVSRTHINRMIADAEAAGLVTLPRPDRIAFSPALADALEAFYAGQIQVSRQLLRMLAQER